MKNLSRTLKLISRLESVASFLEHTPDLLLHRQISHPFYTQRVQELMLLMEEYNVTAERLNKITSMIDQRYEEAYCCWRRDIRWITKCFLTDRVEGKLRIQD